MFDETYQSIKIGGRTYRVDDFINYDGRAYVIEAIYRRGRQKYLSITRNGVNIRVQGNSQLLFP